MKNLECAKFPRDNAEADENDKKHEDISRARNLSDGAFGDGTEG